jgi:hypothetical protein
MIFAETGDVDHATNHLIEVLRPILPTRGTGSSSET